MHRNRVKWTRFQSIKNKYIRLSFYAYKPSPIDLIFIHRNRVRWTWFLNIKTESSGLVFYRCLIYVFFSATRHSNVSLKKTLLSKNSLIPSHTHSPLKKKLFTELKKLSHSLPHSQSSHTHSLLTQKNSVSLSLHSILVSAPVTHSLIRLRRRPSLSLIPSLQLHCCHLLRRRRPSISLRLSLSSGLSLSFPLRRFAFSFSGHTFQFSCFFGFCQFFPTPSDQLQFIFSCSYWVLERRVLHTKKPCFFGFCQFLINCNSFFLVFIELERTQRNRVQSCRFLSLENKSIGLGFQAWEPSPMDSIFSLETESFELVF